MQSDYGRLSREVKLVDGDAESDAESDAEEANAPWATCSVRVACRAALAPACDAIEHMLCVTTDCLGQCCAGSFWGSRLGHRYMVSLQLRLAYFGCVTFVTGASILLGALLQATFSMEGGAFVYDTAAVPLVVSLVMLPAGLWAGAIYLDEVCDVTMDGMKNPPLEGLRRATEEVLGLEAFSSVDEYVTFGTFEVLPLILALSGCVNEGRFGFHIFLAGYIEGAIVWFSLAVVARLFLHLIGWITSVRMMQDADVSSAEEQDEEQQDNIVDEHQQDKVVKWKLEDLCASFGFCGLAMVVLVVVALCHVHGYSRSFLNVSPIVLSLVFAMVMFSWSTQRVLPKLIGLPYYILIVLFVLLAIGLSVYHNHSVENVDTGPSSMPAPILHPPPLGISFQEVSLEGSYAICSMTWGKPGVDTEAKRLTVLDLAMLSGAVYNYNATVVEFLLDQEYGDTALQDVKLEHLDDRNTVGRWGIFYFPSSQVRVFAIRGTATSDDAMADADLFATIQIMQFFDKILPLLSILPVELVQSFVNAFDLRRMWGQTSMWSNVLKAALELKAKCDADGTQMLVTGHSLGGTLAAIVSGHTKSPGLALSPPGTLYTSQRLGLTQDQLERNFAIIQPDHDIVPQVDLQMGMRQRIRCAAKALDCHSPERTLCELRMNCGDPRGRPLATDNGICKSVAEGH